MEPNIIISSLKGKEQNANAQENPLNMDVVKEERNQTLYQNRQGCWHDHQLQADF